MLFFFFEQETAYEMRISDWSSDVCSSDLVSGALSALTVTPSAGNSGGAPAAPLPMVQAILQLAHREVERFTLGANHFGPAASSTAIGVNAVPAHGRMTLV